MTGVIKAEQPIASKRSDRLRREREDSEKKRRKMERKQEAQDGGEVMPHDRTQININALIPATETKAFLQEVSV